MISSSVSLSAICLSEDIAVEEGAARGLKHERLYLLMGEVTVRTDVTQLMSFIRPTRLYMLYDVGAGTIIGAFDGSWFRYITDKDKWANDQMSEIVSNR